MTGSTAIQGDRTAAYAPALMDVVCVAKRYGEQRALADVSFAVNAGEVLTIPPHMPHKAEALAYTVDLDVFNPPRADWIDKTDKYLRGALQALRVWPRPQCARRLQFCAG